MVSVCLRVLCLTHPPQAKASDKRIAATNEKAIRNLQLGLLGINVSPSILLLIPQLDHDLINKIGIITTHQILIPLNHLEVIIRIQEIDIPPYPHFRFYNRCSQMVYLHREAQEYRRERESWR